MIARLDDSLVEEDLFLSYLDLRILQLNSMEDGLSLVCLLFHDCVNILLISLNNNHQFPLFFDQVFLDPLDLHVELILLKGEALLDFFIFLLIHRVVDCTLEFAEESIVFSFLF